jgi:hypothetical protein
VTASWFGSSPANGYDWSHRFPLIVEAAPRNRQSSFVIDGEAVLLGVDGRSAGLHSRQHDEEVQFYAFDMLVSDGEDLRSLALHLRKNNLARLLTKRVDGIFLSDCEQGEIGPRNAGVRPYPAHRLLRRLQVRAFGRDRRWPVGR